MPGGIASHDTFNRVFQALDREELERGFGAGVREIAQRTAGEVVAIDGKTLRGSRQADGQLIVHRVSAWAEGNKLVLAQRKVDDQSNEITAIPKLLGALELSGTVVTIDAIGCQRALAEQIVHKQADSVLAVKQNQAHLLADVKDSFRMLSAEAVAEEIDCGHGRVERRRCAVLGDRTLLDDRAQGTSLRSLVRLDAERFPKTTGVSERETRYYISSLPPDAARLNRIIRQHWGIENKLHWVLDVAFDEDHSRKRAGHAAPELLPAQPHRPKLAPSRARLQTRPQRQTPQRRLEP